MSDGTAIDLALLLFRCGLGAVMLAHGINHIWGGGKIAGTAGWFASMGMRPPLVQAWLASITEIGAGALLVVGLFTPVGGAGLVGTMAVAFVINHRGNGFFIFRPGEGWEYVMTLGLCGIAIGTLGAGGWSLDRAIGLDDDLIGVPGLLLSGVLGVVGAVAVLVSCWRPDSE